MAKEEHFRKLERVYASAPTNDYFRPALRVGEGNAEVIIQVRPDLFHSAGAVHGAVFFKLLDDAAFFAANSLVEDVFVLTASFHLHLLRPVSTGTLRAVGKVVHRSRRLFLADSILEDGDGVVVARGTGTFMRSRIPLDPGIGYV